MKIKVLVLCILLLILAGCKNKSSSPIKTETWNHIVNKEWSNLDIWAGSGMYFYEDEDDAYCTFMIYGSGVRVAGHYTSKVVKNSDNEIMIQLPTRYSKGHLSDVEDEEKLVEVILSINENAILLDDLEFKVIPDVENYKYIYEFENK